MGAMVSVSREGGAHVLRMGAPFSIAVRLSAVYIVVNGGEGVEIGGGEDRGSSLCNSRAEVANRTGRG